MAEPIYDLPGAFVLSSGLFSAGAAATKGGMTPGGISVQTVRPGGRAALQASYFPLPDKERAAVSGFLATAALERAIFRVPVAVRQQLISARELGLPAEAEKGQLWGNGQTWGNGRRWAFNPVLLLASAAARGDGTLAITVGTARYLREGIAIGLDDEAHVIMSVRIVGTTATVGIAPPVRKAAAAGSFVQLRPQMLARVQDPQSFAQMIDRKRRFQAALVVWIEAFA